MKSSTEHFPKRHLPGREGASQRSSAVSSGADDWKCIGICTNSSKLIMPRCIFA